MTDRELLELAAKAAGMHVLPHLNMNGEWVSGKSEMYLASAEGHPIRKWNPLTDDGDALRLAVKLSLHISVFVDAIGVGTPGAGYDELKYEGDPLAATRRAIVRAAAEIGRNMT